MTTDRPATAEPRHAAVQYPGGVRVDYRWAGSGSGPAVFALSMAGGVLTDHGPLVSSAYERLCRAELRVETPGGAWTARLASPVFDDPRGALWDDRGLLVVAYGFTTYAFAARTGELRWNHRARSPIVALLASARLDHVIVQSEIETFALEHDGTVRWRVGHSDVVSDAELVAGRLVLRSYGGERRAFDP
ncbi:MAG TPA: PQQ-binding-like beta-propeller repeat protein, partial [Candidatus Limnocylindrales bacterium]